MSFELGVTGSLDSAAGLFVDLPVSSVTFIYVFLPLLVFEAGIVTDVRRDGITVDFGDRTEDLGLKYIGRGGVSLGYALTVATLPDCPFVDLRVDSPARAGQTAPCRRFTAESLRQLEQDPPAVIGKGGDHPGGQLDAVV